MAKSNVLQFSDDTAKYGIPGIVRVGPYQMGHVVFIAAEYNKLLQQCEGDFHAELARINASDNYSEKGKRLKLRERGADFLGRVDKIAGAHLAAMERKAGEMKADRTVKSKPVDSATEKWIWTQVMGTPDEDRMEMLVEAVKTNDQMVFDAIMNMPKMFRGIDDKTLALYTAEWDEKNLAGASQEEKDIREAHDALEQSANRLKRMIASECGLDVSDVDPLDKIAEGGE